MPSSEDSVAIVCVDDNASLADLTATFLERHDETRDLTARDETDAEAVVERLESGDDRFETRRTVCARRVPRAPKTASEPDGRRSTASSAIRRGIALGEHSSTASYCSARSSRIRRRFWGSRSGRNPYQRELDGTRVRGGDVGDSPGRGVLEITVVEPLRGIAGETSGTASSGYTARASHRGCYSFRCERYPFGSNPRRQITRFRPTVIALT